MVELKVRLDDRFQKKLDRIQQKWPRKFEKLMYVAAEMAHSRATRLAKGPVLKVRSGRLSGSIRKIFRKRGTSIDVGAGSGVFYHIYHEMGISKMQKRATLVPGVEKANDWLLKEIVREIWDDK